MKFYLTALVGAIIVTLWGVRGVQPDEIEAVSPVDPVVVVVNKARILRLEGEADVVLVANPENCGCRHRLAESIVRSWLDRRGN